MKGVNKYGLTRSIPVSVKLEVRKRCGFGCVICAVPIVEYEHVEPTFAEAKEHNPDAIALLCPSCHARVTKGLFSKDKVKLAMREPAALKAGSVVDIFDFCGAHPKIIFGGAILENCKIPIMIKGEPLLEIEKGDNGFLISGKFYGSDGVLSLEIIKNEWICSSEVWDLNIVGPRITIKEKEKSSMLVIKVDAPNMLVVEHFNMMVKGISLIGNPDELRAGGMTFRGCGASNAIVGFSFS